jgi:beta-1,4-galactosyltransferase 1
MKDVAIIVPYRDRQEHLAVFVPAIINHLSRVNKTGDIFIVEQSHNKSFNRGMTKNIGFLAALETNEYSSYVFHDIDMVPKSDVTYELVNNSPTHFATNVEQFGWKLPYPTYFGGVIGLSKEHCIKCNGYSNGYWGWGAEDDDFYDRIVHKTGLNVLRSTGVFNSLYHIPNGDDTPGGTTAETHLNRRRLDALRWLPDAQLSDGLNNLNIKDYPIEALSGYYLVKADI